MRWIATAIAALALHTGGAGAQILPPMEGYEVDVSFSDALQERMTSINNLEQRYEERFREHRNSRGPGTRAGTQRFAEQRTGGTEWAGERLIAEVSGFTVENLVKAMVAYNINRVAPAFGGRVDIHIDELRLSNPSLAFLDGTRSAAAGTVRITDANGYLLLDERVQADLVVQPTVDTRYQGPEFAFIETEPPRRVGPTLAQFVERALEQAWPDRADELAGPIIVRISGPGDRLLFEP